MYQSPEGWDMVVMWYSYQYIYGYKEALYQHEAMDERLNAHLENGYHMERNGDEIYYIGEDKPIPVQDVKRKR